MDRPRRRRISKKISSAWQRFYESDDGRAAIADFLTTCNVYSPIEERDPIEAHRLEGERRAALRLVHLLSLRPSDFVQTAQQDTDVLDLMMRDYGAN